MTAGNAGRTSAWVRIVMAGGAAVLASCMGSVAPLRPAWQQDANLFHQGFPARLAQTSATPHLVVRAVYADPSRIHRLIERQGDVPDVQHGMARMGDGTLDVGFQDAASGQWLDTTLCGGVLFVTGLPNQAYRIVLKNRTPMPLAMRVGVDGRDMQTGAAASLKRGEIRLAAKEKLVLDRAARGALLFKSVKNDSALFDVSPQGRTGLVQIAVFLASEAPSIGPEKLRPDQVVPLGLFPVGVPEQYR